MCDLKEIWRFEAKWIAKTNEHAKLRFDSINRTDEAGTSSVPFKLDKIVLKGVEANDSNIIFNFEFKKNVFVGQTIVHYVSICVPNLPNGWNIPYMMSTLHDDNSVFKNILRLADAWISGIKSACSPQCNLQLVCSKEQLGKATCFISFSICKDHKNWESAKDELIAVAASTLKFDPPFTSLNAFADDCNKTKTKMNAAATISKNDSKKLIRRFELELNTVGGNININVGDSEVNDWVLDAFMPLTLTGETLKTLHYNDTKDVVLTFESSRSGSDERTLQLFVNDLNNTPPDVCCIVRELLVYSEKISKYLTFTSNLLDQWLHKTDERYKPSIKCRMGFFSNGSFRLLCELYIGNDSMPEYHEVKQWQLNNNIIHTFVDLIADIETKTPNALWTIKSHVSQYERNKRKEPLESYVIGDLLKFIESAAAPTRPPADEPVVREIKPSWWHYTPLVRGIWTVVNGVIKVIAGDFDNGIKVIAEGAASFVEDIVLLMPIISTTGLAIDKIRQGRIPYNEMQNLAIQMSSFLRHEKNIANQLEYR